MASSDFAACIEVECSKQIRDLDRVATGPARGFPIRIDALIAGAAGSAKPGSQEQQSAHSLKEKIDRWGDSFAGLGKSGEAANEIIDRTRSARDRVVLESIRSGLSFRDVF